MEQRNEKPHPGIRIHAIPVAGVGGLLFMIGAMLVILIGVPAARYFLIASVVAGVVGFVLMRLLRRR